MSLATDLTEYCIGKKQDEIRSICEKLNISYTELLKLKSGYTPSQMVKAKIEFLIQKTTKPVLGSTNETRVLESLKKDFEKLSDKRKKAFKWVLLFTKKTGEFPCVADYLVFIETIKNSDSTCANYETNLATRFYRFIKYDTSIYKFKPREVSIHYDKFI